MNVRGSTLASMKGTPNKTHGKKVISSYQCLSNVKSFNAQLQ